MTDMCLPGERADRTREAGLDAVVAVDVDRAGRTLRVLLLGAAPDPLPGVECVRIDGPGPAVRAVAVRLEGAPPPTRQATLLVTLDRLGDGSPYTLRLVDPDRPDAPLPGFDPRHSGAEFTFACATESDCAPVTDGPVPAGPAPALDHLAKDYASFRRLILDRLALISPEWADREVPDLGVTLVELLAYVGDRLSYRQDAVATEAYLHTARLRTSVRRHLRLVDHRLHDGCNARTWVHLEVEERAVLRAGTYWFATALRGRGPLVPAAELRGSAADFERYEPMVPGDLTLRPAHNRIRLWTWDGEECCLPAGATSATLIDPGDLACGDVLILEEVRGPVTGAPGDADPRHRQAVRLTAVEETTDPVREQRLLRVAWSDEDALAFPLCLAAVGGDGCLIEDVSVARGNVVLVDHGSSGTAPVRLTAPADAPVRWLPHLTSEPLTRRSPHPAPARTAAAQARTLEAIPARAAAAVADMRRRVTAGEALTADDLSLARTLWGERQVAEADLPNPAGQSAALTLLRSRSAALLARRTARLARLAARARLGTPLDADAAAEVTAGWGPVLAAGLDPTDPRAAGPASAALTQDPRDALPQLTPTSVGERWAVRADLLDSGGDDPHVVVEAEEDGTARLRFGDGTLGRAVTGGQEFVAAVRVGNGPAGNAGPETVLHLVVTAPTDARIIAVRNPLPAVGGTAPESVADARRLGPTQYRHRLVRAVTADDYSALAGEVSGVQRAATDLAWNGSWYEADVAVAALGRTEPAAVLLDAVHDRLQGVRRIGHDLRVDAPRTVAVEVRLLLCLAPDARRAAVERAVGARITRGLLHPDRLTFGSDLCTGRLVAEAMAVPGVVSATVERLRRAGAAVPLVPKDGVLAFGPLEIPWGALDLDVVGGR
ncbi:putative baseplate assembly protein [Streptomyces sp. NPDC049627]|uniref:putative baseplate assembly protein n=1 Tax=Streptomyces sp. NPDC049627 TaxID=3365595 RepID=UPI0037A35CDD